MKKRKLALSRETVLDLSGPRLDEAAGGTLVVMEGKTQACTVESGGVCPTLGVSCGPFGMACVNSDTHCICSAN